MSSEARALRQDCSTAAATYTIQIDPQHHALIIDAQWPQLGGQATTLFLPVWTPGSYLIREYARHVEHVHCLDDTGLATPCAKARKNAWLVPARQAADLRVRYTLYAHELSVRTNYVCEAFALIVGAGSFLAHKEVLALPHDVRVVLPPGWDAAISALQPHPDGFPQHFRARHFDQLVDAPIFVGKPLVQTFDQDHKPVALVTEGADRRWNSLQAFGDVQRLVRTQCAMWGGLPCSRYVMFNLLVEGGKGGLEHQDSAVLLASPWSGRSRADYLAWLGLVSHEFFHIWNVKRLRPIELGPFDYEVENPTQALWFAEGATAYYDDLLVHRSQLSTRDEYIAGLGAAIARLQSCPGRLVQPLGEASYDAWIKFYRRDENSDNATVNYYLKGSIVAFLLDAKIRRLTRGQRSLDDVMRLGLARFAGALGYTQPQLRALCSEVAQTSLELFFHHCIDTAAELDYSEALDLYGLTFAPLAAPSCGGGSLGIVPRLDAGRLLVAQVRRGGAAWTAGLAPEDELLGIDDWRIDARHFLERLKTFPPQARLSLLIARRERLLRVAVQLTDDEAHCDAKLSFVSQPTAAQTRALQGWLSPPSA